MSGDSFVHLHVHTDYSMLDGAARIPDLYAEAVRLGMPAIAMTDHGNLHGSAAFYREAKKHGIKPIIGIEAYVAPGSRFDKKRVFWGQRQARKADESGEGGDVAGAGAYTHMTMLAADATGLRNLFRLSSRASFEGQLGKWPRMDRELISEHAEGIIATTGCPSGEVQTRLRLGQFPEALQAAADYRDIFGPDNFFVELMDHGLAIEHRVRGELLDIARKLNLRPLATNDSHYVTPDQASAHDALLCLQTNTTLDDPKRFKFGGDGYYLKSPAEMRADWDREVPGAADNTLLVAERVQSYDEVYAQVDRQPRFPLAEGETEDMLLRREVERSIPSRFPDGLPPGYRERLDYELGLIAQMGFPGYFLVVADLVEWMKRQGIAVGPGRGSAAGSLVAYVRHITDLDPIEHGLLFERFINPERVSPPDIDLDVDEARRGEAIDYMVQKWGAENVAQVTTFGTIKTKAAIKDAARVLYGPAGFALADRISRALPEPVGAKDIPIAGIFDPKHERYGEAGQVRQLVDGDAEIAQVMKAARGLEGLTRQPGVHACAVILSSQPLLDVVPLLRHKDGSTVTAWDYPSCEDIGLLKMDLLSSRTLRVIGRALREIRANHGVAIDLATLPVDDEATYELLRRGDTLSVFQLDNGGVRDLLRRMEPKRFADIGAVLALYRPGPMAANAHIEYAERSCGRREVEPIHPELAEALEPILAETYQLIVYQEQVMAIAQQLAGYSLGGADLLRRAMGKKKPEILAKEFETFQAGMAANGYSEEAIQTLWAIMIPFAEYAFNKAHSAAYAVISYRTAYLKANYPAEFMAAQLTAVGGDKERSALYLAECRRMGIKVLPPDINESVLDFVAAGSDIRFGLGAIRNVGATVVESIIRTREQHGPFTSFFDFLEKIDLECCNKGVIQSLIKAGAFDSLGHTRLGLFQVHEDAVEAVTGLKRQQAEGQFDLFGAVEGAAAEPDASPLAHLGIGGKEWPRKPLLGYEREMLGRYVSAHPLDGAERILRQHAPQPIAVLAAEAPEDGEVVLAGVISAVELKINRKGDRWAIVTIEDLDASIEVLFFAKAFSVLHTYLVQDSAVAVKGRVSWRDDRMSIRGLAVIPLDVSDAEHNPGGAGAFVLEAEAGHLDHGVVTELKSTLTAHRGETPVHLVLRGPGMETTLALDEYPVTVTPAFVGELKGISGITVGRADG